MTSNGAVPKRPRFSADPSGAPDLSDEPEALAEPQAPTASSGEGGDGGATTATAAPPVPRVIVAKGPYGEDLRLRQDAEGNWYTEASSVTPPPVSAPVDHPLLGRLRARTNKPRERVQRAVAYNHRMMWFMKADGDVVKLQGDPGNRAYYEDKGYVPLTPEEVQQWERPKTRSRFDPETGERTQEVLSPSIRAQVVRLQRERAQIITTITNIARRHAAVEVTGDLSITPTEELQAMLEKLQRIDGPNFTLLQAREPEIREADDEEGDSLDNLEIGRGDELSRKVDAYHKMARTGAQQQIGGRQRMNGPVPVDLSGS
jgi:hypothetical protein